MTQPTIATLEAGGFDGIIEEGPGVFREAGNPPPCFVHHRDAGGWCERPATMRAFGINFCGVHGAEVRAGIAAEVYGDAARALDALGRDDYSEMNPAEWVVLQEGRGEMARLRDEAEEEGARALVRAYPVAELGGRVDPETLGRDFRRPDENEDPVYVFGRARTHALGLMRLSWSAGEDWLLEILEEERQTASAQLAFALALRAEQTVRPLWTETAGR